MNSLTIRFCVILAGSLILVFAAFGAATDFGFINFDDPSVIVENEVIEGPGDGHFRAVFTEARDHAYLPIYYASFWIDHAIGGKSPRVIHSVNLVLHALVGVLLYFVLCGLIDRERRGFSLAAALGAALFLVHPVVIESAVWASGRKDLVSGFLFLAAFLAFRHGYERNRALFSLGFAPLLYLLALFAKASVLPGFLLVALQFAPELRDRKTRNRILIELLPLAFVAMIALVVHLLVASEQGTVSGEDGPLGARIVGMLGALGRYALNVVAPLRLSLVYDMPFDGSFGILQVVGILILVLFLFALKGLGKSRATYALGLVWFVVALAPFNNILPRFAGVMADRYLYIPVMSLGLFVAGFLKPGAWRPVLLGLGICLVAGLAVLSRHRTEVWSDSTTLWEDAREKAPEAILPLLQLGQIDEAAAVDAEPEKSLRLLDDAARHFSEALEVARTKRGRAQSLLKLASLETRRGRFELALEAYEQLEKNLPEKPSPADLDELDLARVTKATALAGLGRLDEARRILERLRADSPAWAEARQNQAAIVLLEADRILRTAQDEADRELGIERYQEGLEIYRELVAARPKFERARVDYASALIGARWVKDYEIEVTKAVDQLVKDFPKNAQAWYHHARVMSEVDALRALNDLKIAVQLDPYREEPYLQLVRLLRGTGNNKEAKLVIDKGLRSLPDSSRLKQALAETYVSFGYHHRNTQNLDLALESAALAVEVLPEAVAGWQLLGEIRQSMADTTRDQEEQRDNWVLAERAYRKVLELDPRNAVARKGIALYHRVRGYSYIQIRLPKELKPEVKTEQRREIRRQAMEEFLAAIEMAPGIEELDAVEGQLLSYAAEFRDAADDLLLEGKGPQAFPLADRALHFGGFHADNQALMARTKAALGLREEARRYYEQALKLDRKHLRSLYDFGRLCYDERAYDEAAKLMQRFLDAAPPATEGPLFELRQAAEQVVLVAEERRAQEEPRTPEDGP